MSKKIGYTKVHWREAEGTTSERVYTYDASFDSILAAIRAAANF